MCNEETHADATTQTEQKCTRMRVECVEHQTRQSWVDHGSTWKTRHATGVYYNIQHSTIMHTNRLRQANASADEWFV